MRYMAWGYFVKEHAEGAAWVGRPEADMAVIHLCKYCTFIKFNVMVYLFVLISRRSFERATGEVPHRFEEGASDPGHQERGVGAGQVIGGVHYHRWCADLPWLPLRVSWRLVRAPAPQVRNPLIPLLNCFTWTWGLKDSPVGGGKKNKMKSQRVKH